MRLLLLFFIVVTTLCVEGQHRQLRRFSPARSRLRVNVDQETNVENVEPEIEVPPPIHTRSRQRSALRPRPFSARFSGRINHKDVSDKTELTIAVEPSTTKAPARGQRRRPHFHRRLRTTTKPPMNVAEFPEEETIQKEISEGNLQEEEIIKKDESKGEITMHDTDLPPEMTKSILKSKPITAPKIRHRPIPLRRPRISSRKGLKAQRVSKPNENIVKPSKLLIAEPLETTSEIASPVDLSPKPGSRHRFSGGPGLIGGQSRLPKIKAVKSQNSDTPSVKPILDASQTIEYVPVSASIQNDEPPIIQKAETRNISVLTSQSNFDQLAEDVKTMVEETDSDRFESINDSSVLNVGTSDISKSAIETSTTLNHVDDINIQSVSFDNTNQNPADVSTDQLPLNVTMEQTPLEITTSQKPAEISSNEAVPEVPLSTKDVPTESYFPNESSFNINKSKGVLYDDKEHINISTKSTSFKITTETAPSKMTTIKVDLEITATQIPSVTDTKNIPITTRMIPNKSTTMKVSTEVYPTIYDNEYDYDEYADYIYLDYPQEYTYVDEGTVLQEHISVGTTTSTTNVQPIRNSPSHLVPEKQTISQTKGLIGTVENTPPEQVRQILSGLGSRRRGLSRI